MNIIKSNNLVTILTPTYNREGNLLDLYNSLINQENKGFSWLIIDDGSTDNTEQLVSKFIAEGDISIKYIKQKNGGKHRALNNGIKQIRTELTFIVDSDDILTEDAIKEIHNIWNKTKSELICGVSFLRGYTKTEVIGKPFEQDLFVDTYNNVRFNMNVSGDKAEIWVTKYLKEIPFMEIEGENFFSENYVWVNLSNKYKMIFINKIIYITEYLDGGLTKSGRKLLISCPIGGMANAKQLLSNDFSFRVRYKNALLYTIYGLFAKKKIVELVKSSGYPVLLVGSVPIGYLIFRYWKIQYT